MGRTNVPEGSERVLHSVYLRNNQRTASDCCFSLIRPLPAGSRASERKAGGLTHGLEGTMEAGPICKRRYSSFRRHAFQHAQRNYVVKMCIHIGRGSLRPPSQPTVSVDVIGPSFTKAVSGLRARPHARPGRETRAAAAAATGDPVRGPQSF